MNMRHVLMSELGEIGRTARRDVKTISALRAVEAPPADQVLVVEDKVFMWTPGSQAQDDGVSVVRSSHTPGAYLRVGIRFPGT